MSRLMIAVLLLLTTPALAVNKSNKQPAFGKNSVKSLIRGKIAELAPASTVYRWVHYKTPLAKNIVRQVIRADKDAFRLIALGASMKTAGRAHAYADAIKRNDPKRFKNMAIAVDAYFKQLQQAASHQNMNLIGLPLRQTTKKIQGKVTQDILFFGHGVATTATKP